MIRGKNLSMLLNLSIIILFLFSFAHSSLKKNQGKNSKTEESLKMTWEDCSNLQEWDRRIATGNAQTSSGHWGYFGGDSVLHKGQKYTALWGGSEEPGSRFCNSDQTCRFNGIQWMTVGQCRPVNQDLTPEQLIQMLPEQDCFKVEAWQPTRSVWPYNYFSSGEIVQLDGVVYMSLMRGKSRPLINGCLNINALSDAYWQWRPIGRCRSNLSGEDARLPRVDCRNVEEWRSGGNYMGGHKVRRNGIQYSAMWGGTEVPGDNKCYSRGECSRRGLQWISEGIC